MKTVKIAGLNPKWKSRVSQYGTTWIVVKEKLDNPVWGTMFITDSYADQELGHVAAWVTPGVEVSIVEQNITPNE